MAEDGAHVRLRDLAEALKLSIGTVSRALQDHPGLNTATKQRVLGLAKSRGYKPNLAARYLKSKRSLRIGINTPQEIAYFYNAVRRGIGDEAAPYEITGTELVHRTFPVLGDGEKEAFEAALDDGVDALILVPGIQQDLRKSFRRATRMGVPIICVVNDMEGQPKLSTVSVNTGSSAALVADLMGRFMNGEGSVGITLGDLRISDQIEKYTAFRATLKEYYPKMKVLAPVENHEREEEAYSSTRAFLRNHRHVQGLYACTGVGPPVLRAVEDAGMMGKLTLFFTDFFEDLVPHIRSGAASATLYERPYSQGRIAFRLMQQYLSDGKVPPSRVVLEPLLIMRSNIEQLSSIRKPGGHMSAIDQEQLALFDLQS